MAFADPYLKPLIHFCFSMIRLYSIFARFQCSSGAKKAGRVKEGKRYGIRSFASKFAIYLDIAPVFLYTQKRSDSTNFIHMEIDIREA